jgi:cell division protease FtsH
MDQKRLRGLTSVVVILASLALLALPLWLASVNAPAMPYSEFRKALAAGEIEEVAVAPKQLTGRGKHGGFSVVRVDDPDLVRDLVSRGVKVTGELERGGWSEVFVWLGPLLLFAIGWRVLRRAGPAQGLLAAGRSKAKIFVEKEVKVRFDDVAGVDEAKDELREVIDFLRDPRRFGRLGAHIPKGVLLVGPPGTGKTLLARAVAGEAAVPFFSISGSEFVEMFVGVGAARVRDLFTEAREKAPCIIFIDELDALGKVRQVGPAAHEEREQTLNQLLVEMDGFDPSWGVILMAATNRPEILDPALLRAGRFDRQILVDRPDREGRLAILRVHARQVALADDADLDAIAGLTAGLAGADLANIVNEAALLGVRRELPRVGRRELEDAVERVVAGLEKRNRVLTAEERRRVAHHEVGHALVALLVPGADPVRKISIIPRGVAALGYTLQVPAQDRFVLAKRELEDKIAVFLGGQAAERLVLGEASTGGENDLTKATALARSMVMSYGMSEALGAVDLRGEARPAWIGGAESPATRTYSEQTAQQIDAEVRRILDEQRRRAGDLLRRHRDVVEAAATRLLAQEVLTGDELREMLPPVARAAI